MKRLVLLSLAALAACGNDWRTQATVDAEDLVKKQIPDPSLRFSKVQFTGNRKSGQTCGHYEIVTADGSHIDNRFIVFIDGGRGQNPYTDDPSTPYPWDKDDFDLNWSTQCVNLGYKE